MDQQRPPHPGVSASDPRAIVGWRHRPIRDGIELEVEASRSLRALEAGEIERTRLCMTRNQALLLARYLLQATDQPMTTATSPRSLLARLRRYFR